MSRQINEIAREIAKVWGPKVNYAAKPYLSAMLQLETLQDNYYQDDARGIVLYFLSNASSFRGEDAKRLKAELKALLK